MTLRNNYSPSSPSTSLLQVVDDALHKKEERDRGRENHDTLAPPTCCSWTEIEEAKYDFCQRKASVHRSEDLPRSVSNRMSEPNTAESIPDRPHDPWMGYFSASKQTEGSCLAPIKAQENVRPKGVLIDFSDIASCVSREPSFEEDLAFGLAREYDDVLPNELDLFVHTDDGKDQDSHAYDCITSERIVEHLAEAPITPTMSAQEDGARESTPPLSIPCSHTQDGSVREKAARYDVKSMRACQQITPAASYVPIPSGIAQRKRKRKCSKKNEEERGPLSKPPCPAVEVASTSNNNDVLPSALLDVNFLLAQFEFTSVYGDGSIWLCPFSLGNECGEGFTAKQLMRHLHNHLINFEELYPGEVVECPLSMQDECNFGGEMKRKATKISVNDSLARHVIDGHYKARSVVCPCGREIGRYTKDQIIRHLDTRSHREKMSEKRDKDPRFAEYLDIRDPGLLDCQRQWKQETASSDREEGSSKGRKCARRS